MVARRTEPNRDTPSRRNGMSLRDMAQHAVQEFVSLVGEPAYRMTGVRRLDDGGWSVLVDVVELERIPQSTSLLATYRVDVDDRGRLVSYERLRRFTLGAADPT
ncbi:MAG TPA: gas vesicle protein GvpO [Pseudonocardiaceae bacterium]|nr:gas vesicle protein GvpO [Pseudonocardiaceae bacterium]